MTMMKNGNRVLRKINKPLLGCAVVLFALGLPLFAGWWAGEFQIFWTTPGAALVQVWGGAAACLWGVWLLARD